MNFFSITSRTALLCPEHLYKTYAPNLFDLSLRITHDPLQDAIKDLGNRYEAQILEKLRATDLRLVEIDSNLPDLMIARLTAQAMVNPEVDLIYGANFNDFLVIELAKLGHGGRSDHRRVSRPDLLVNTGQDSNGIIQWRPVDIKSHRNFEEIKSSVVYLTDFPNFQPSAGLQTMGRLQFKDGMQLAHYLRHLQELGFASQTPWAGVLGKDSTKIAWADLDALSYGVDSKAVGVFTTYELEIREKTSLIEEAIKQQQSPTSKRINIPQRISGDFGCSPCEYRKVCFNEMKDFQNGAGHVTLLSDITAPKAKSYLNGIENITDLAKATNLVPQGMTAVKRAQVWISEKEELLDPSQPFSLPEFDVEIDIDLENSQAILQELEIDESLARDSVYLYGYGIHDRTQDKDWESAEFGYFEDYSDTDDAEYAVLSQMWNFMESQVELAKSQGKSIGFFHYSPHEKTWWKNYAKRHAVRPGVPTLDHIEAFMANYLVDLMPYAKKIAFPLTGYSIKTLAPYAGFEWKVDDAGGGNSIVYFKQASSDPSEARRKAAQDWLRSYNRDDVKATMCIRSFLRTLSL